MKNYCLGTSLFWVTLSVFACNESLRLGIGTVRNPGMGFMAFGASVLLGILSIILFFKTAFEKEEVKTEPPFAGRMWKKAFLLIIALMVYARFMPLMGYLFSTFLLMSFLFWFVKRQRWWRVFGASILVTIITYYIFSKWLNCQFPEGLFRL